MLGNGKNNKKQMSQLVSIIVPVYNSSKNLNIFLESFLFSKYRNFEIIVNDDLRSSDNSAEIVDRYSKYMSVKYVKENQSMAQGRKRGVDFSSGNILIFLDSDMRVSKDLIGECVEKINDYDALVIPEESYGETFWAKCKWLEKKCYDGISNIESLRCVKRRVYEEVGGHNENMVFSEDKDFDIRTREVTDKIGRTEAFLYHNEGKLILLNALKKKLKYSSTADLFAEQHPNEFKWQSNPFNRYVIFLKNIKYFFKYPFIYLGMVFMKTCEYLFAFFGLIGTKFKKI